MAGGEDTSAPAAVTPALYTHLVQAVATTPWAIRTEMLAVITDLLAFRAAGGRLTNAEIRSRVGAGPEAARTGVVRAGSVAVIPLRGVIVPRADMYSDVSGMASLDRFRNRLREAAADDQVQTILCTINSPGGVVDNVPETAAEIMGLRGKKRMVAIADAQAASAAYWIGSAFEEFNITPSGEAGSIGVYQAHTEYSRAMDKGGVKTTLIRAGRFKAEGNPYQPLTEEAQAAMQKRVDEYYGMFTRDVARGRGVTVDVVRGGFGEGRVVGAAEAVKLGMADRVATFEETIRRLQAGAPAPRTGAGRRSAFSFA
ncbi:MAG TPA: S49 family peptidase [Azospirillum sp.]|nr:S49 family peptidase [Azospirillum sp.]